MKKFFLVVSVIWMVSCSASEDHPELKRWKKQSDNVTIIRDTWGIPHIYGKTNADAVFGLMYAQCEESFERVEQNYIEVLGRKSELYGRDHLLQDFKMKVIYDTAAAMADYKSAPGWLKKLCDAFADGINYYLYTHPETRPLLITRFEPWFPLMFPDGAYVSTYTGGLTPDDIKTLYGKDFSFPADSTQKINGSSGSNAFALAPSKTATGNSMIYINPHVTFYFRTEMHLVSEEGLNAYGGVTWGQFFVFQGFNEHCGWAHTFSVTDVADLYEEKFSSRGDSLFYEYNKTDKPVSFKTIMLSYKSGDGKKTDSGKIFYTHHGPVMGKRNGKWLSVREQNRSMNGLIQSWQRMLSKDFTDFKNTMNIRANASTNTIYADDKGNIAYWHGNRIPKRDAAYNWELPVVGADSATEWKGIHEISEIVHVENPTSGWIQNCNSSPFNVSGENSIDRMKYPSYMAPEKENFRSIRAITLLKDDRDFTLDKLIKVGYDNYLAAFDSLLPPLFAAYDRLNAADSFYTLLQEPVKMLRAWDRRSTVSSGSMALAVFWTYQLLTDYSNEVNDAPDDQLELISAVIKKTSANKKLSTLYALKNGLQRVYGNWQIPWGEITRYQRSTASLNEIFSDERASTPVGLAPQFFGSLPSYETVWQNNQKQYGIAGNSIVIAVEFGKNIKAKAIKGGGQSFDPDSKHFNDQSQMFIEGKFRDVFFYKADINNNKESKYHPGEK